MKQETTTAYRILAIAGGIGGSITICMFLLPVIEPHRWIIALWLGAFIALWPTVAWIEATCQSLLDGDSGWLAVPRRMLSSARRTIPVAIIIVVAAYVAIELGLRGPTYWTVVVVLASSAVASVRHLVRWLGPPTASRT